MSQEAHLEILAQGVRKWNRWRRENPQIKPSLPVVNFAGQNFDGANFSHASFDYADLSSEASFCRTNFEEAFFNHADLSDSYFINANLKNAYLGHVNLDEAVLTGANLSGANLEWAHLMAAELDDTKLKGADLSWSDLSHARLINADLRDANLTCTRLVQTSLSGADLTGCRVYGISAWRLNLEGTKQLNLTVTPDDEPSVTVDDLEVAQFIYLLLNHKKLRNVINSITERGVLILGRFADGGIDNLNFIADRVRERKYLPIIFNFDRPQDRNLTETIKVLAGLSRFIIADLSGPSVPQELYATVPHFKIPFVPVIEKGRKTYAMFSDLIEYPWVLPRVEYSSKQHLAKLMTTKIIKPAERKYAARRKMLKQLFDSA